MRAVRLSSSLAVCMTALLAGCASSVSLDEPLEGTPWRLVQLDGQAVMVAADPQAVPRIQFDASGQRMSGSGGCNQLTSTYRRSGRSLRIGPVASTRMACPDAGRAAIEGRFVQALDATTSYDLKGAQLTLLDARSMPVAVLELGLRGTPPP